LTIFPGRFIIEAESFSGSDESDLTNEHEHNRNRTSSHLSIYSFIIHQPSLGKPKRSIKFRKWISSLWVSFSFGPLGGGSGSGSGSGVVFTIAKSTSPPTQQIVPLSASQIAK
jgi:hypothetical protein